MSILVLGISPRDGLSGLGLIVVVDNKFPKSGPRSIPILGGMEEKSTK
jgi:hypothetical protein